MPIRKKNNHGQPWTSAQVKTLRSSRDQPAKKIADKLKRSVGAIRSKAYEAGISLGQKTTKRKTQKSRRR